METITQTQDNKSVRILFRGQDAQEMYCFMNAIELLDIIVTAQEDCDLQAVEDWCKAIAEGQGDRLLRH